MALTKAQAKSLSILDVARSLGMEMRRSSHKEYYWKEHDSFKIDTTKNTWNWYSRGIYGDTIDLVQEMRQITYGQAIAFLDHGDYPEAKPQENVRQPFKYTLSPYEEPFNEARDYLKTVRGLSDETINFFLNRGMLAQARRRTKDGYAESVLVFKSYSRDGEMVGASLQGLTPNKERYEGKGYLKQTMYQSEGISGLNVAIGSPKRLVVAEAPIDLMSYYELHKETLEDVRLVAMDGLKEGLISHYAMELLQDLGEIKDETFDYTKSKDLQIASNFLKNAAKRTTLFHNGAYQDLITLAVDNDKAGTDFLESLRDKDIPVIDARPPKEANQEKMDWNDYLKQKKKESTRMVENLEKSGVALLEKNIDEVEQKSLEPFSDTQKAHIHEFFKTRVSEVKTDYIYLPSGQEDVGYYLDGYLFAHHSAELDMLSPSQQVDALMERLATEDGQKVDHVALGFDIEQIDQKFLEERLGYNPDTPIEDYRQSEKNSDRIAEKEEKDFRDQFDRQSFAQTIGLMQKYSPEEVLNESNSYHDEVRYQSLLTDLEKVDTDPMYRFIERYINRDIDRKALGQFSAQDFMTIAQEKDLLNEAPSVEPWKAITVTQPVNSYTVLSEEFDNVSDLYQFVNQKLERSQRQELSALLSESGRGTPLDTLMAIDSVAGDVEVNGLSVPSLVPDGINEEATEIYRRSSAEIEAVGELKSYGSFRIDDEFLESRYGTKPEEDTDSITTALKTLNNLSLEGIGVDNDPTECVHTSTVDVEGYQLDLAVYSPHTELEAHGRYDWSLLVLEKTEPLGFLAYGEDWFNDQVTLKEKLTDLQTWLDQGTVKKHLLTQQDYTQFLESLNEKRQEEEGTKKAPEQLQEATVSISEQTKKEGTNFSSGSLQLEAEGSPTPVVDSSTTFERSVTSRPTLSPHLLHFSINEGFKSSEGGSYQYINQSDLNKLNRRADIIQEAAQYYLNELANSKISYVTSQGSIIQVNFQEQNFMHLTGIKPLGSGQTPEKTLHDLASGNGEFENIMLANAGGAFSKINVLPDLPVVLSLDAFYFDNLQDLRRYNGRFDSLLKTDDKDIMLLFRVTEQDGRIPVSLWEARNSHLKELQQTTKNEIVAIYREREGKVEQIALDEVVIKDGGKEIQSMLESKDFSPIRSTTLKEEVEQNSFKYDSDGDGISDEEELKQGTNPYDFRSTPSSKGVDENTLEPEETFLVAGSVAVADLIKNKDITGLNQHLKEGIKAYLNSENYKNFLTKMSQFNQYSSRNLRLILAQKPDASYLAPYNTWKKFDRHVKRGEKALSVIIPVTYVKKDQQGHPILDKNGKPETGLTFRLKPTTFDVSQTEGKAMPKAAEVKEQLTDLDYANLYRALMSIAKTNNVSVRFEEMEQSTFGYYNPTENQIVLRSNEMNKSQIIKTFLHETAHSELHHNNNPQQEQLTKSTAELQAESVAYVVASYYGIDTADYSFDYLAGWSNDKETLEDLEAQLDIVQQEAKSLMVRMDQELEQLRLVQQRQSQQQFEQKLQKYKDQTKQAVEDHKKEIKEEAQSKKEKGLSK